MSYCSFLQKNICFEAIRRGLFLFRKGVEAQAAGAKAPVAFSVFSVFPQLFFLLVVVGVVDALHKYLAVIYLVGHCPFEQSPDL